MKVTWGAISAACSSFIALLCHQFSTELMSLWCICSLLPQVQQFCHDINQAVTFTAISLPHYCGVGDSQMYRNFVSSAKAVPPLVLCSHTSLMCWVDWYDHCFSIVYFLTCFIILWHVALWQVITIHLCHLMVNFSGGNRFCLYTIDHTTDLRSVFLECGCDLLPRRTETLNAWCPIAQYSVCLLEQVPSVVAIAHQIILWIASDWLQWY